jgi:hypothetical protein
MSMRDVSDFTSESDSAELCRRSHGDTFGVRIACLLISVAVSVGMLSVLYQGRVVPDEVALGNNATAVPSFFQGHRVSAWRFAEYPSVYAPAVDFPLQQEWLWLGNSQLHAINQPSAGDIPAPGVASELVGFPVYGLSLPNASLVEHLGVVQWALSRRQPSWVILPVVYDDLRNDEYRPGWEALQASSSDFIGRLKSTTAGAVLAKQIARESLADTTLVQKTSLNGETSIFKWQFLAESCQTKSEDALDSLLRERFLTWARRDQMYAKLMAETYHLRNWVFGITPQTKRAMIPQRFERNMAALGEIADCCKSANIPLLIYVCPLRFDIEPPYIVADYEAWKVKVFELASRKGAHFADLDRVVSGDVWGTFGSNIDFMHFRGEGHRILGTTIVNEVRRAAQYPTAKE